MGVLAFISSTKAEQPTTAKRTTTDIPVPDKSSLPLLSAAGMVITPSSRAPISATLPISTSHVSPEETAIVESKIKSRRFPFLSFGVSGNTKSANPKPVLSAIKEQEKRVQATEDFARRTQMVQLSKSDKRAQQSALVIRSIIVGPTSSAPSTAALNARSQLDTLKVQLTQKKSAKKLIMQLHALPAHDEPTVGNVGHHSKGPIHAVCLEHPDEEEHQLHFTKLLPKDLSRDISASSTAFQSIASAPIDQISDLINEMHVIDLIGSSDFGLGQPGNANGILAGAVPTAETVLRGFQQITPELMALGYATGKVITPDHTGIHPPTDRMSILTYWWGFELLLPTPSLVYLEKAHSVSGALMNFLSALSLINNGVREILPFIRYISQFVDFEFSAIKAQDEGHGVVCAATWIIPAALVPRPWDFPLFTENPDAIPNTSPPVTLTNAEHATPLSPSQPGSQPLDLLK